MLFYINDQQTEIFTKQNYDSKPVFGSVVSLISDLFEESGGRAMIFSCCPNRNGPGIFTDANSPDQEQPFISKNVFFEDLALKLNRNRTSVDLFMFNHPEFQLATVGPLTSRTGGTLYYYPTWDAYLHSEKLYYEIHRNITRYSAQEVACRIRTTNYVNL